MATLPQIDWPDLQALDPVAPIPDFPIQSLPLWLAHWVSAEAYAGQTPLDLAGMLSLAALSTVLQGRVNAVANRGRWPEPVSLYVAIAMNPGERKSAVFGRVVRPIQEWELRIQELEAPRVAASRQRTKELEQHVDATQRDIVKRRAEIANKRDAGVAPDLVLSLLADLDSARERAVEAQLEFDKHRELAPMRLLFDDITPEAAATALFTQDGERMGILSSEGGIFDILAGRYSDKPALDIFLKGHSGDSYRVDRKGRDSEVIRRPVISLGLTIQPSVLQSIGASKDMHGRGLLARFLYCVPETALGSREVDVEGMPKVVEDVYFSAINDIASVAYAADGVVSVFLSDEADEAFMAYQTELEPRLKPEEGDLDQIVEWASKLAGALLRIATLIAVGRVRGIPSEISVEDMRAALDFAPYLEAHALQAYAMMGLVESGSGIERRILRCITRHGWEQFTTRELMRAMNHRGWSAEDADDVLDSLAASGYVFRRTIGPKRWSWLVNPSIA